MDFSKDALEQTLRDTWDTVKTKLEGGTCAVRDTIGQLPFLASVAAAPQHDSASCDEHHYFLVPTPFAADGYAIYTVRRLPEDATPDADLPQRRVFHLPADGAEDRLVDLVLADRPKPEADTSASGGGASDGDESEPLASRLERVADEIDRHERMVTGGILLIGGAVAVANPLLGVGIAAKAIIPSIGALLSREGLKYASDKLKGFTQRREQAEQDREDEQARTEFARVPVHSFVNPLLQDLERALTTTAAEFDPSHEVDFDAIDVDGWNRDELVQLTARAITESYGDAKGKTIAERFEFGPEDRRWLESLRGLAGS